VLFENEVLAVLYDATLLFGRHVLGVVLLCSCKVDDIFSCSCEVDNVFFCSREVVASISPARRKRPVSISKTRNLALKSGLCESVC
jgi:hypothetical protein